MIRLCALLSCLGVVAGCSTACNRAAPPSSPHRAVGPVSAVLPLGPAAPLEVATGVEARVAPSVDAWGQTLAVAWQHRDGDVRVSVSPDAGRSFQTQTIATVPAEGVQILAVAVHAPFDLSMPSNDGQPDSRVEVWCRVGDARSATVVRSRDGGRTFGVPASSDVREPDVFPAPWESTSAASRGTLALLPPPLLRYVGVQTTARPATVVGEGIPPLTLDEHGALAMVWRERTDGGEAMVLRRYAVDWQGKDATTSEFDAPTTVVPRADIMYPALTRVPGGIVAVWIDGDTLRSRRIGLDMTCNPNRNR